MVSSIFMNESLDKKIPYVCLIILTKKIKNHRRIYIVAHSCTLCGVKANRVNKIIGKLPLFFKIILVFLVIFYVILISYILLYH